LDHDDDIAVSAPPAILAAVVVVANRMGTFVLRAH